MPPKAKGGPGGLEVSRLSVRVTADTSTLLREIRSEVRKIEKAVKVTVKIDGDLDPLKRRLDEFRKTQGDRVLKLKVSIDLSAVRRELAAFRAVEARNGIRIPVHTDAPGLGGLGDPGRQIDSARSAFDTFRKTAVDALQSAAFGFVRLGVAGTTVLSVLPSLIQLVGALARTAAGVGIVGAAGLVALATGAVTAVIALKPLVEAVKAYGTSAEQASANSRALADAQQALTAAQERLADAGVDGPKRVATAERNLADAQKRSADAQKAVTDARKAASQALADLRLQLAGAALDEESATLAVEQARARLNEVNADPLSTNLDTGEAVLGLKEAEQRLNEVRASNERLRDSAAAAQAAGVDGAQTVVDAQQQQAQAAQGVVDAQDAVTSAQRDSARESRDAAAALKDAAAALIDAKAKTSDYETALAKLSPSGRAAVATITSFLPAFRNLRSVVQENLFTGLPGDIQGALSALLPVLTVGLGQVARGMGSVLSEALGAVSTDGTQGQLATFLANTGAGFDHLASAVRPFVDALGTIGATASEFFPRVADAVGDIADRFNAFVQTKAQSGELSAFLDKALTDFATLGRIVGDLGSSLGSVFHAADGVAGPGGILGTIELLTGGLGAFLKTAAGQGLLTDFFGQLQSVFNALMPVISEVVSIIGTTVVPIFANLITAVAPGVVAFLTALGSALQPLIPVASVVGQALGSVFAALSPLLPALGQLAATLLTGLAQIVIAMAPSLELLAGIFADMATTLVDSLGPVIPDLVDGMRRFSEIIVNNDEAMAGFLEAVIPLIPELLKLAVDLLPVLLTNTTLFAQVLQLITPLIGPLIDLLIKILDPIAAGAAYFGNLVLQVQGAISAMGGFGEIAKSAVNGIIDVLNVAVAALNVLINGLNSLSGVTELIGISYSIPEIPDIPHLARGGMTSGPTAALIGDNPSGNELVAPLDSPRTVDLLAAAMGQAVGAGKSGSGTDDLETRIERAVERAMSGWKVQQDPRGAWRTIKTGAARDAWAGSRA